ncbi:unnamed protein product, partial [Mesorhabditis belari]|uniref:Uncharacterized protein n=1 Tax=Mesorhabditis belari TaxID=2138241 RepID=A0AAF3FQE1_9BILA
MYPFPYNVYNQGYNQRVPFIIPRPYVDDFIDLRQNNEKPYKGEHEYEKIERALYVLRFLSFAQIFTGGVLLVTDISKIVLIWNYLSLSDVKLEYVSQLMYPVFVIVLGFVSLSAVVSPSASLTKFLLVLVVVSVVPTVVLPRYSVFITAAIEAMALARAAEQSFYMIQPRDLSQGMIQSEAANKLMRMLSSHNERWPLGIKDLSQLSPDYTLTVQYLLVTYAMFSFVHLLFMIVTLVFLLRLLRYQQ